MVDENGCGTRDTGRRTFLRGAAATTLSVAGLSATTGSAGAATEALQPGENEAPNPNAKKLFLSDDVRGITDYWHLLTTDSDLILDRISASSALTETKDEVRAFLKDVWDTYPTERVSDGNVTTVQLASRGNGSLGDDCDSKFDTAANVVAGNSSTSETGVEPMWVGSTHQKMATIVAQKVTGISDSNIETISSHAEDPDRWEAESIPGFVPGPITDTINQVFHSWGHYYNPDLLGGIGGATTNASQYLSDANSSEENDDTTLACKEVAWASHFIIDVGNPLHTGAEVSQEGEKDKHIAYESWINNNWTSGENFQDSADAAGYYVIDDGGSDETADLADYAHDYIGTIWDTIQNNPDSWKDDSDLIDATENCLTEAAYYNRGFVENVFN